MLWGGIVFMMNRILAGIRSGEAGCLYHASEQKAMDRV
jgi:hypothetical protein